MRVKNIPIFEEDIVFLLGVFDWDIHPYRKQQRLNVTWNFLFFFIHNFVALCDNCVLQSSYGPLVLNVCLCFSERLFGCDWSIYRSAPLGLTRWGRVTHICVSKPNIGLDNGLSPIRRLTIIWTNFAILSIIPLGTYFSEISFKIQKFAFKKMHMDCRLQNVGHFVAALIC